jgi:phosphopantothenoylcysteine decarboxylase/phosphopantothenate--cysteine ligase
MSSEHACVIVGISGGIAAYKTCGLVSSLHQEGCEVHVLMTAAAQQFITPLTLQTLSGQRVITDMFSTDYEPEVHHISLARKADVFVIAPASADIIAKIAGGIADDMLTTTFLAADCPKLIVPAMNTHMLENPATQRNLELCRSYGIHILESSSGYLACGDTGRGRMPEPKEIADAVKQLLMQDHFLQGRKVLITAGPTREALDPVRCLTNYSSGKMGYALARAARNAGAEVTLVSGVTHLDPVRGVQMVPVISAQQMYDEVTARSDQMDVMILAAAVADYRPREIAADKIHKRDGELTIELERTQDILAELGRRKKPGQVLIGFAMETADMLASARQKLERKNCDFIIANNVKEAGAGFEVDTNRVTVVSPEGETDLGLLSKDETAAQILRHCLEGAHA